MNPTLPRQSPCRTCGACCSTFRVSFYWAETEPELGGRVPVELTEQLTLFRSCMKGTSQAQPRCIALQGQVGQPVACSIFHNWPQVCQDFGIQWDEERLGWTATPETLGRCNGARQAWGLSDLTLEDGMLP